MIEVDTHLKWGAYCCLQSTQCTVRIHRRSWARSALFVVETMLTTTELRICVPAFRLVHEARETIKMGLSGGKLAYVRAAREDLFAAALIIHENLEGMKRGESG